MGTFGRGDEEWKQCYITIITIGSNSSSSSSLNHSTVEQMPLPRVSIRVCPVPFISSYTVSGSYTYSLHHSKQWAVFSLSFYIYNCKFPSICLKSNSCSAICIRIFDKSTLNFYSVVESHWLPLLSLPKRKTLHNQWMPKIAVFCTHMIYLFPGLLLACDPWLKTHFQSQFVPWDG